jgi:hypothetical protein
MTILTTNDGTPYNPHDVDFATIWEHYRSANFLYPAKLQRLGPLMGQPKGPTEWPRGLQIRRSHTPGDGRKTRLSQQGIVGRRPVRHTSSGQLANNRSGGAQAGPTQKPHGRQY